MNDIKEALIIRMAETKLHNIQATQGETDWIFDVLSFGWQGYVDYPNSTLLEKARDLLKLQDLPTLEELGEVII